MRAKHPEIEVVYAVPSQLARMLADGEIAAALVSSFEYFRTPGYVIAPGVSISGQGDIESVRAFAKASLAQDQVAGAGHVFADFGSAAEDFAGRAA